MNAQTTFNTAPEESVDSLIAEVNSFLIDRLENGASPWADDMAPRRNTGEPFRGINALTLGAVKEARGYTSPFWLTEAQARRMGGKIRDEEAAKGAPVLFIKTETDGTTSIKESRGYRVFNASQIDGLPEAYYQAKRPEAAPEVAEELIAGLGLKTAEERAGKPARYDGQNRVLFIPPYEAATHAAHLGQVAQAVAEAGQATGKVKTGFKHEGDPTRLHLYTTLTGAFVARHLGGETRAVMQPAALQDFARVLRTDPHAIFKIASKAEKAADYLLEHTTEYNKEARNARYTEGFDPETLRASAAKGGQVNLVLEKPSFKTGEGHISTNASAEYRRKREEARRRLQDAMNQRPIEGMLKRGVQNLIRLADDLTN